MIAPKVVRPSLPYAVSVNILKSSEVDHIVRVEIRTAQNDTVGARVVNNVKTGYHYYHSPGQVTVSFALAN